MNQALASAMPPAKRAPAGRPAPKLGPYRAVIDGRLESDRGAPRKQRHTARRIYRRLVDEHAAQVAERPFVSTSARAAAMGVPVGEVFVPQAHPAGMEAEVDWGEALVVLGGVSVKVQLFVMRASFSGAAFCQASWSDPAGVLGAARAGVRLVRRRVPEIRFDNLKSAVKKVLKGRRRIESDRFVALRSHYCSCRSSQRRAWKARTEGGVEGKSAATAGTTGAGPELRDLAELNAMLLAGCEADLGRPIMGGA